MSARYVASKVTSVAASVALVGGGSAWIATAGGGTQAPVAAQQAPATIAQRVYLVQRVAPDGSTYYEPLSAPPSARAAAASKPVTRTRAS